MRRDIGGFGFRCGGVLGVSAMIDRCCHALRRLYLYGPGLNVVFKFQLRERAILSSAFRYAKKKLCFSVGWLIAFTSFVELLEGLGKSGVTPTMSCN
jgi:hypothetical protein